MQIIKEIRDAEYPKDESIIETRESARAIIFDDSQLMPLLFASKHNFHKLPGGGIDEGEKIMEALAREIREETGCEAEITDEIGQTIEFRSRWNLKQISYCYLGKIKSKGEPSFTDKEINEGFEIVWFNLEQAISKLKHDQPNNYEGEFIQKRDLAFLEKAQEILELKQS